MANVINLQFSDKVEKAQHYTAFTGTTGDNTDLGYFIGTDALTVAYANIFTSGEVTSGGSTEISASQFDRVNTGAATFASTFIWNITNYIVSVDYLVVWLENNTSSSQNYSVQAFDERTNGTVEIATFSSNSTSEVEIQIPCTMDFFTDSLRIVRTSGGTNPEITEIYMYGFIRRKNGASLGLLPPPAIVEDLADSKLDTNFSDGWLEYKGFLFSNYRHAYEASGILLSGNFQLGSGQRSNVLALDPGGANREVYLPLEPKIDNYLRVINANGAFSLIVKDEVGGTIIVELSNATTILSAEFIWEQTDQVWHVTY